MLWDVKKPGNGQHSTPQQIYHNVPLTDSKTGEAEEHVEK